MSGELPQILWMIFGFVAYVVVSYWLWGKRGMFGAVLLAVSMGGAGWSWALTADIQVPGSASHTTGFAPADRRHFYDDFGNGAFDTPTSGTNYTYRITTVSLLDMGGYFGGGCDFMLTDGSGVATGTSIRLYLKIPISDGGAIGRSLELYVDGSQYATLYKQFASSSEYQPYWLNETTWTSGAVPTGAKHISGVRVTLASGEVGTIPRVGGGSSTQPSGGDDGPGSTTAPTTQETNSGWVASLDGMLTGSEVGGEEVHGLMSPDGGIPEAIDTPGMGDRPEFNVPSDSWEASANAEAAGADLEDVFDAVWPSWRGTISDQFTEGWGSLNALHNPAVFAMDSDVGLMIREMFQGYENAVAEFDPVFAWIRTFVDIGMVLSAIWWSYGRWFWALGGRNPENAEPDAVLRPGALAGGH